MDTKMQSNEKQSKLEYLMCPAQGDIPFLVETWAQVEKYLVTEEYYCYHIPTSKILEIDGREMGVEEKFSGDEKDWTRPERKKEIE